MLPTFVTLNNFGPKINVDVKYSNKAKRIIIRVKYQKAELILPNQDFQAAYIFLLKNETWLRKELSRFANLIGADVDPHILPIAGKSCRLQYINANYNKVQVYKNTIKVYFGSINPKKLLINFLKELLSSLIYKVANKLSKQYNLSFNAIKIIDSKTRWGSCCSKGILSFNWRLAMVPPEVLYYVIVHEMCHLRELNHSNKFWALVISLCPNYKIHKQWLKDHGHTLHQYLIEV